MNNYLDFQDYLETEYEHIAGEFYECMGNHQWHTSDIELEYERLTLND